MGKQPETERGAVMAQIAETGEQKRVRHFVMQPDGYRQIMAGLGELPYNRVAQLIQAFQQSVRAVFDDEKTLAAATREPDPAAEALAEAVRFELEELEGERLRGRVVGIQQRLADALVRYEPEHVEPEQEAQ